MTLGKYLNFSGPWFPPGMFYGLTWLHSEGSCAWFNAPLLLSRHSSQVSFSFCPESHRVRSRSWFPVFLGGDWGLEKEMAIHSSTIAWKIPWIEEPGKATVHGVAKSRTRLSDFTLGVGGWGWVLCPAACRILVLQPEIDQSLLHRKQGLLTTRPSKKSLVLVSWFVRQS